MHFHYFALDHLARYLNGHHAGEQMLACFSQNKNELVVEMEEVFLRIGCNTPLTYVAPVRDFAKARKNVVDLFPEWVGERLLKARAVPWERALVLEGQGGQSLTLKLHGIMANVMLSKDGKITGLFNRDQEKDWFYQEIPGPYDPEARSALHALRAPLSKREIQRQIQSVSPVFDKQFAEKAARMVEEGKSLGEALDALIAEAESDRFFLCRQTDRIRFFLFEPAEPGDCLEVKGIAAALSAFIAAHFQYDSYRRLYREIQKKVERPFEKFQKVYASYQQNIEHLETDRSPEEIGHLLMANLHAIEPGAESVELDDFYTEGKTTIKLKPTLTPQDNAARYYAKHKQRKAKLNYLKGQLDDIEQKLLESEAGVEAFRTIPAPEALPFTDSGFDARELRELKKQLRLLVKEQEEEEDQRYPFRTFHKENYQIFVGRNAKNNDLLSFKFANKEDIWLHAKDVVGSHVIIRSKPGKTLPVPVLEYAAGLAAFYSKRKNDSLVPVQYTPRKHIRKRKGDPAGMVVVEREDVILVEPVKGE